MVNVKIILNFVFPPHSLRKSNSVKARPHWNGWSSHPAWSGDPPLWSEAGMVAGRHSHSAFTWAYMIRTLIHRLALQAFLEPSPRLQGRPVRTPGESESGDELISSPSFLSREGLSMVQGISVISARESEPASCLPEAGECLSRATVSSVHLTPGAAEGLTASLTLPNLFWSDNFKLCVGWNQIFRCNGFN